MKVPVACHQCHSRAAVFDVADDGVYNGTCDQGHVISTVMQNRKYELLFESALLAYEDGYFRDCVASSAAALEDVYRTYVQVIARAAGLDAGEREKLRKQVKLSERLYGAAMLAYATGEGKVFPFRDEPWRDFRNGVIHEGKFPLQSKAFSYAEFVHDAALELLRVLRTKYRDASLADDQAYVQEAHEKRRAAAPRARSVGTGITVSMLGTMNESLGTGDFAARFEEWKTCNLWVGSSTTTPPNPPTTEG